MNASRAIRLNAFDMACVGHIHYGMWTHPRDRSSEYTSLDYWVGLASMLERGLFDGLFLADVLGASRTAACRDLAFGYRWTVKTVISKPRGGAFR